MFDKIWCIQKRKKKVWYHFCKTHLFWTSDQFWGGFQVMEWKTLKKMRLVFIYIFVTSQKKFRASLFGPVRFVFFKMYVFFPPDLFIYLTPPPKLLQTTAIHGKYLHLVHYNHMNLSGRPLVAVARLAPSGQSVSEVRRGRGGFSWTDTGPGQWWPTVRTHTWTIGGKAERVARWILP